MLKAEAPEKKIIISQKITHARSLSERLFGLMFKHNNMEIDGMLIEPCNSIHTFFMNFPLDVLFIDKKDTVVKVIRNMTPWKMSWLYLKSKKVLEVKAGLLPKEIMAGDRVKITRSDHV